jgi:uncharacterized membrane protein
MGDIFITLGLLSIYTYILFYILNTFGQKGFIFFIITVLFVEIMSVIHIFAMINTPSKK